MFAARIPRSLLAGLAATASVLALVAGGVAARGVNAAPPNQELSLAGVVQPAPVETSTTTSSTTTTARPTTTTSTSTSTTSTTVAPKPVVTTVKTTVAPKPTVPPAPASAPAAVPAPTPAPSSGSSQEQRCVSALQWVSGQGLNLPGGWGFRCPGSAVINGVAKWGLACWNCAGDGQSYIAVDIGRIGSSDAALRYVVAHEICHAIDYMTLGASSEVGADLCAALHGAPRP